MSVKGKTWWLRKVDDTDIREYLHRKCEAHEFAFSDGSHYIVVYGQNTLLGPIVKYRREPGMLIWKKEK